MAFTKRDIDAARAARAAREAAKAIEVKAPPASAVQPYRPKRLITVPKPEDQSPYDPLQYTTHPCPECGEEMLDIQANCTKCGYIEAEIVYGTSTESSSRSSELTQAERERIYQEEKARIEARRQIEAKQKAQGCLVLLVVVFGFWIYAQIPSKATKPTGPTLTPAEEIQQKIDRAKGDAERQAREEKSNCEDGTMAFIMSQEFVQKQLKAPSTAKFPWASDVRTSYLGECRHRVNAYVDSQNAFGAMIRTRYTATMHYLGQRQWRLEELRFLQ